MGHLQAFVVTHYLLVGLQREIHIFVFTYTGHEAATLLFIYILFGDVGLIVSDLVSKRREHIFKVICSIMQVTVRFILTQW
jgi:hypothetical protein